MSVDHNAEDTLLVPDDYDEDELDYELDAGEVQTTNVDGAVADVNNKVDDEKLNAIYETLGIHPSDERYRFNVVFVKGVERLTEYQVEKIFAEYAPQSVQFVDESSCTVRWGTREEVGLMMIDMTKAVRRVRHVRKLEEGELEDSDGGEDEQGDLDGVAMIDGKSKDDDAKSGESAAAQPDYVEVDVDAAKVPIGKWRIVSKHVPEDRMIFVRYATGFDVRRGVINPYRRASSGSQLPRTETDPRRRSSTDGEQFNWKSAHKNRVRPGLNIFNEQGEELDWDYEHDTRFFTEPSVGSNEDEQRESPTCRKRKHSVDDAGSEATSPAADSTTETVIGGVKIRSRGRGSKKLFLLLDETESAADQQQQQLDPTTP